MPLTRFQELAVEVIRLTGGKAICAGGGYWKGANGEVLRVAGHNSDMGQAVGTATLYSLEKKGVLRRANERPEAWRDTRILTEGK